MGAILDQLGIRYVVGGSVAASIYGEPRSTLDLDIMIEADEVQVTALAERLRIDFYVDVEEARRASRDRTSFNAIHFETSMRIDFFVAEGTSLSAEQLSRRRTIDTPAGPVTFYAPEDLVIRKLLWYRSGGGQSERQWRDVVRVLAVSGPQLDLPYLERTADALSLADLLSRALEEARA